MRSLFRVALALLIALLAFILVSVNDLSIAGKPAVDEKTDTQQVVTAINSLALDLYPKLLKGDENLFFSPYSISAALAMTYAGARGETAAQMAKTLHFSANGEGLALEFGALNQRLFDSADRTKCRLDVSNALWGQKGLPFLLEFKELIWNGYYGRLIDLDFKKAPEAARKTINKAVEEQTQGKIVDLMVPGSINDLTRLVLTNAIYFKGTWAKVFRERQMEPADFTLLDGSKIRVPMMHQTAEYGYAEVRGGQVLEMPYKGHEFSMVVFLPSKPTGWEQFEQSLNAGIVAKPKKRLRGTEVSVWLPKFTVKTPSYQLGKTLAGMGMSDAFDQMKADFSGIDGRHDLFLQDVLHKAFVNVNETGTEAAAATAARITKKITQETPPVFRADHPFLYVIRHNPTNCILFMGRLTKP